ncbi:PIR protein [Plasmodium ovale]|uniref:PIR protein n=1 Tax=Plasmodium ovale TaxID=36330 RepID=A0A1D3JCZ8_PLAOA|nr:PIR protein [Plasmodium ovale]
METLTGEENYNLVSSFLQYKEYFDYDNNSYYNNYLRPCNIIKSTYFNDAFISPCVSIAKYLTVLGAKNTIQERLEGCKYLSFRLNIELQKITNPELDTLGSYQKLINQFNSVDSKLNVCQKHIEHFSNDVLENLKRLNVLHEKFHQLKNKEKCNGDICVCAKNFYDSYMSYKDSCDYNRNNAFCKELGNFKEPYDEKLSTLMCDDKAPRLLPSIKVNDQTSIILMLVVAIIIIPIIIFILYKFTSFGPWAFTQMRRKEIIWKNIIKKTKKLLKRSENHHILLQNSEFNIKYH